MQQSKLIPSLSTHTRSSMFKRQKLVLTNVLRIMFQLMWDNEKKNITTRYMSVLLQLTHNSKVIMFRKINSNNDTFLQYLLEHFLMF